METASANAASTADSSPSVSVANDSSKSTRGTHFACSFAASAAASAAAARRASSSRRRCSRAARASASNCRLLFLGVPFPLSSPAAASTSSAISSPTARSTSSGSEPAGSRGDVVLGSAGSGAFRAGFAFSSDPAGSASIDAAPGRVAFPPADVPASIAAAPGPGRVAFPPAVSASLPLRGTANPPSAAGTRNLTRRPSRAYASSGDSTLVSRAGAIVSRAGSSRAAGLERAAAVSAPGLERAVAVSAPGLERAVPSSVPSSVSSSSRRRVAIAVASADATASHDRRVSLSVTSSSASTLRRFRPRAAFPTSSSTRRLGVSGPFSAFQSNPSAISSVSARRFICSARACRGSMEVSTVATRRHAEKSPTARSVSARSSSTSGCLGWTATPISRAWRATWGNPRRAASAPRRRQRPTSEPSISTAAA